MIATLPYNFTWVDGVRHAYHQQIKNWKLEEKTKHFRNVCSLHLLSLLIGTWTVSTLHVESNYTLLKLKLSLCGQSDQRCLPSPGPCQWPDLHTTNIWLWYICFLFHIVIWMVRRLYTLVHSGNKKVIDVLHLNKWSTCHMHLNHGRWTHTQET